MIIDLRLLFTFIHTLVCQYAWDVVTINHVFFAFAFSPMTTDVEGYGLVVFSGGGIVTESLTEIGLVRLADFTFYERCNWMFGRPGFQVIIVLSFDVSRRVIIEGDVSLFN